MDSVRDGDRVLILAHRGELLEQAADKIRTATGLLCATEKRRRAASAVGTASSWVRADLMRENALRVRLRLF